MMRFSKVDWHKSYFCTKWVILQDPYQSQTDHGDDLPNIYPANCVRGLLQRFILIIFILFNLFVDMRCDIDGFYFTTIKNINQLSYLLTIFKTLTSILLFYLFIYFLLTKFSICHNTFYERYENMQNEEFQLLLLFD